MEFVNQTVIGPRELAALAHGARKSVRKRRGVAVRVTAAVIIGLNALFAWASFRAGDSRWWVNGAVALFLLAIVVWEDQVNAKFSSKYILPDAREVTAVFLEDFYKQTSKAADSRFQYDQIQAVCETKDYFLLYLSRNLGQIYDKKGFTKGTAMAFRQFLSNKTGLQVRQIR